VVVQAEEGGDEPNGPNVQRRLFENNVLVTRPLVRTLSSASRASQQNGPNDLMIIALASFMAYAKLEETERQYRLEEKMEQQDWKRKWNNRQQRRKRRRNANKKSKN
jgi:hypothetical protein